MKKEIYITNNIKLVRHTLTEEELEGELYWAQIWNYDSKQDDVVEDTAILMFSNSFQCYNPGYQELLFAALDGDWNGCAEANDEINEDFEAGQEIWAMIDC